MPQLATVVSELLSYLRDQSLERYRSWGAVELDFTEEELEEWLTVIGAAVLSVLTGYVVQTQLVAGGKKGERSRGVPGVCFRYPASGVGFVDPRVATRR